MLLGNVFASVLTNVFASGDDVVIPLTEFLLEMSLFASIFVNVVAKSRMSLLFVSDFVTL